MGEVKLIGSWTSPFVYRIIWALKLKGIPFEFIEEDIFNKSDLLLKYNPVHKKIPVLVHGGKSICESIVILEYIDETWPQNPLLPNSPYDRAIARFWVKFAEDKGNVIWPVYRTNGEAQEKAIKESVEMLKTIEEHALARFGFLGEKFFFGGHEIGVVDIAFGSIACWLGSIENVGGVKLLEEHSFPRLLAWAKNFKDVPVIKENLPDHENLVAFLKRRKESFLPKA